MANLVVCCDGTWNTEDQHSGDVPTPTNVVLMRNCIADSDAAGNPQEVYYHPGVGTDGGPFDHLMGGAFGQGLCDNIKSAYRWLASRYTDRTRDRVYLFGFSRGAYTARSLAGMISTCGLLNLDENQLSHDDIWQRVEAAFRHYRKPDAASWGADSKPWAFHHGPAGAPGQAPYYFIGVWDTVGALGIPDDLAILNLFDNPKDYSFHHTGLSPLITCARHAVGLDEQRASYTPTLWNSDPSVMSDGKPRLLQIYFPGVHCDVGGGYAQRGLSDGALKWMIEEAGNAGLAMKTAVSAQIRPDALDVLHDSLTGPFKKLRTQPRRTPRIDKGNELRLHDSVLQRQATPPITQPAYWKTASPDSGVPCSVDIYARQHWNYTGIWIEPGVEYAFETCGQWKDASITCGPAGAEDGSFQLGKIAYVVGDTLGMMENLFHKCSNNQTADFVATRREEELPWFSLVGVIANGGDPKPDGTPEPHEVFLIGSGQTKSFTKGGYLYCYANDAWQFYDNNRGSVRLTVEATTAKVTTAVGEDALVGSVAG